MSSRKSFTRPCSSGRRLAGTLARDPVSFENVGDVVNVPGSGIEGSLVDRGDRGPRDAAVEERGDRHLVGAAEHGGGAATRPTGLVGQAQARERFEVGRSRR